MLPDGFLIEYLWKRDGRPVWSLERMNKLDAKFSYVKPYRPAFNYWHFSEYIGNLPIGLVIDIAYRGLASVTSQGIAHFNIDEYIHLCNCDAAKIIGVMPEYEKHGKELGMEVIEI